MVFFAFLIAAVADLAGMPVAPEQGEIQRASCSGEYADDVLALSRANREFERQPESSYAYCLRNTATYECLSYGADGRLRRRHVSVVAHGTAFAYREKSGETLLLTNDHVATWPAVTDDDHDVADVPDGCKKVDEQLRLVRNESDDDEAGQVTVTKVVTDPSLDAAILKTKAPLAVMPYRIGRSAALKAGNAIVIRGYPLGLLQATNSGRVVSPADPDRERGWNHLDFVTDALVTKGNSGSPAFAVSCRTGQLELVGLYHAGYRGSPALNTVVGIDQLRGLMEDLVPTKRVVDEIASNLAELHGQALAAAREGFPFFKLGDRVVRVRPGDAGALFYDVFGDGFPAQPRPALSLEEGPDGTLAAFVTVSRIALKQAASDTQDDVRRLHDLARRQWRDTVAWRAAQGKRASELSKAMSARKADAQELLRTVSDAATKLATEDVARAQAPGITGKTDASAP